MANDDRELSRRQFLGRCIKTSALAGVALAAGAYFRNRHVVPATTSTARVRPFGVPGTEGIFAAVKGRNPHAIARQAVETAGGMSRFVSRGDKVLIKVNCAFARPAWVGATTSPEVTSEIVAMCYEAGAAQVRVTDNPISDPESCFARSGLNDAVEKAGGQILLPRPADFRSVRVSRGVIGTWDVFCQPLRWCDKLIGIPTVKTHNLCGASLGMKNWYGFFGGSRSRFHQQIQAVIVELAQFITPTLVVLDGTRLLMRNGPTGGSAADVTPGDTVAVSTDQVALDAFGAKLLSLAPSDLKFIGLAERAGLGTSNYAALPHYQEVSM